MRMNWGVGLAVGLCVAAGGARAEDWTGFRVGAGYGWGEVDIPAFNPTLPGEGTVSSVFAGFDRDLGAAVIGGEIEWSESDLATTNRDFRVTEVLRVKLRAGYDAGRFLPYAVLGLTAAEVLTENPPGDQSARDATGRTLGFGLDMAVTPQVVVGAEILFDSHRTDVFEYLDNYADTFEVNSINLRAIWRF